jgi:uncharacterized membrane protein
MTITLIILCGIMAGVYFTFSVFVMQALATLEPLAGAEAMNAINREIVKTLFLPIFFGSTVLFLVLVGKLLLAGVSTSTYLTLAAALLYIGGMFIVTVVGNVPMNNQLAALAQHPTELADYWPRYVIQWTRLNHVRTICSALATFLLCLALQY